MKLKINDTARRIEGPVGLSAIRARLIVKLLERGRGISVGYRRPEAGHEARRPTGFDKAPAA